MRTRFNNSLGCQLEIEQRILTKNEKNEARLNNISTKITQIFKIELSGQNVKLQTFFNRSLIDK